MEFSDASCGTASTVEEDAADAEIVRERLAKVNADPAEVVSGAELEAKLKEIVG